MSQQQEKGEGDTTASLVHLHDFEATQRGSGSNSSGKSDSAGRIFFPLSPSASAHNVFSKQHSARRSVSDDAREEMKKAEQDAIIIKFGSGNDDDDKAPEIDDTLRREADQWRDRAEGLPGIVGWVYVKLFLVTVEPTDTFDIVIRKLMICTAFCYSPCSVAIGGYWLSLLTTDSTQAGAEMWTARLIAGISAVFAGLCVFLPSYLYIRFTKTATEGVIGYWIIVMAISFLGIALGAPRYPSPIALFSLCLASVLCRSELMLLHIIISVAIYGVSSYNLAFVSMMHGWGVAAPARLHEGSSAENLLLTLIGAFIVVIMAGALYLNHIEHNKLVMRSTSTAAMSRAVAEAIKSMDMQTIKRELKAYRSAEFADHNFSNNMASLVKTVADFSKFCPKSVVTNMLRGGGVSAKVDTRNVIVGFCDICTFTTFVDMISNEQFVMLMGIYFDGSTRILSRHGITVVKYIGDCWMSVIDMDLHPRGRAALLNVCAALSIQSNIRNVLRPKFEAETGFFLAARIGLHRGAASVGVIGSKARLQFDVLGAVPTLASRLEGLGKHVNSMLTVSEELLGDTLHEVTLSAPAASMLAFGAGPGAGIGALGAGSRGPSSPLSAAAATAHYEEEPIVEQQPIFAARRVGLVTVKGKLEPTAVYQVIGVLPDAEFLVQTQQRNHGESGTGTELLGDSFRSAPRLRCEATALYRSMSESGNKSLTPTTGTFPQIVTSGGGAGGGAKAEKKEQGGDDSGNTQRSISGNNLDGSGLLSPVSMGVSMSGGAIGSSTNTTLGTGNRSTTMIPEVIEPVKAVLAAAKTFRATQVVLTILDEINSAQTLYERAKFSDAGRVFDRLLHTYGFPRHDHQQRSQYDTSQGALLAEMSRGVASGTALGGGNSSSNQNSASASTFNSHSASSATPSAAAYAQLPGQVSNAGSSNSVGTASSFFSATHTTTPATAANVLQSRNAPAFGPFLRSEYTASSMNNSEASVNNSAPNVFGAVFANGLGAAGGGRRGSGAITSFGIPAAPSGNDAMNSSAGIDALLPRAAASNTAELHQHQQQHHHHHHQHQKGPSSPGMSPGKSPQLQPAAMLEPWPQFLEEALLDEEWLRKKLTEIRILERHMPADWEPILTMTEK